MQRFQKLQLRFQHQLGTTNRELCYFNHKYQ